MSWIGKMIGGTIGFALAGPLGGIAGAVFGHAFDKSEDRRLGALPPGHSANLSPEEQAQMTFFIATFSMLAKLAAADGKISKEETLTIERFIDRDLGLTPQNKKIAFKIFNEAVNVDSPFEAFAQQFYREFQARPEMLDLLLDILFRVSLADGVLSPSEEQLLHTAGHIFNFSDTMYQRIKERYTKTVASYYAVLKANPEDSNETIKKQYRKLASEYHPDKIAAKGLPEEFTKFATEKFQEIQEAYETIKKERGL